VIRTMPVLLRDLWRAVSQTVLPIRRTDFIPFYDSTRNGMNSVLRKAKYDLALQIEAEDLGLAELELQPDRLAGQRFQFSGEDHGMIELVAAERDPVKTW